MRLLMHLLKPMGFLLYLLARESAGRARALTGWALDAAYGPPQLAPMGPHMARPRPMAPGRAVPQAEPRASAKQVPTAPTQESPQVPREMLVDLPVGVSDRVKTASIHGPGDVILGVLWVYTYPNQGIAKRLFKVMDRGLARALGRDRYFYPDVPFDTKKGVEGIMSELRDEVAKLLDRRKPLVKEPPAKAHKAPAVAPTADAVAEATKPQAALPAPSEPASNIVAPTHRRQVKGEVFAGRVTLAGLTSKQGKDGPYKTFCLTIHDGEKEVPLFGAELERQAVDLKIQAGDNVRVVFMGKQPVEIPGKPTSFKNLYQLTRVTES